MRGLKIIGSGRHLPGRAVTNHDLARVMDTNDEWVRQRTGIVERHYCPDGVGVAELAQHASEAALEDAGLRAQDIDYILFNTMTPDHFFPGSGPLLGERLGIRGVPALDMRTQCAAMVFSFQVAQGLLVSGAARRILLVGAENHASLMPWTDWDVLTGESDHRPSVDAWQAATEQRGWAIIFGDGAGALILESSDESPGVLGADVHSDGGLARELLLPAGFAKRPFVSSKDLGSGALFPHMNGREVFKNAVSRLPLSVKAACEAAGVSLEEVDWFIGHQANDRINNLVRERLGVPAEKVPSNISKYGNTSTATIPILMDEMRRDGRLRSGQTLCVFALGAGMHWGAVVVRA